MRAEEGPAGARRDVLRLEVRRFATEHHRRRRIPTTVHVGSPGGARRDLETDPAWDPALRTDVLLRLMEGHAVGERPRVWVSRGGDFEVIDSDLVWLRAARVVAGVHGQRLHSFVVVTRHGWRDLVTDQARRWARSRPLAGPVTGASTDRSAMISR